MIDITNNKDYFVFKEKDDMIFVGVTNFNLLGSKCLMEIRYNNKFYKWKSLDVIPNEYAFCSVSIYERF